MFLNRIVQHVLANGAETVFIYGPCNFFPIKTHFSQRQNYYYSNILKSEFFKLSDLPAAQVKCEVPFKIAVRKKKFRWML